MFPIMRTPIGLLAALEFFLVQAHYIYPALVYKTIKGGEWQHVRMTKDRFNKAPVQDVLSVDIRCDEDPSRLTAQTLTVAAGTVIGFDSTTISHPGPLLFYLAKVPAGKTAATWDGSGVNWFKIYEDIITVGQWGQINWPSLGVAQPSVGLPASLPSGDYLIRVEHIALHGASTIGGAQFYLACGQINVTNGGNGAPGPLVAFPGAYSPTDPGILYDMYSNPKPYKAPGPVVWKG